MKYLATTTELSESAEFFDSAATFFGNFGKAFESVRCQILKVETRQSYIEPDNPSYEALASGDWGLSMQLLEAAREVDRPLYDDLRNRGVDFLRCRPIKYPLTQYLKWEFNVYEYNSKHCERIFCCNYDAVDTLFTENIGHDFMVFDSRIAFIHNYDENGLNKGGWMVTELESILSLQKLFVFLKSFCQPYQGFMHGGQSSN